MDLPAIRSALRTHGLKLTPQRELIVDALLQSGKPLTAREVFKTVRRRRARISFDTVYRNLGLLCELGLVNRINLQVRFNSRFEIARDHRHHLVCLGCGEVRPVNVCPFREVAAQLGAEQGFSIVNHAFEVYGYCAGCNTARRLPATATGPAPSPAGGKGGAVGGR